MSEVFVITFLVLFCLFLAVWKTWEDGKKYGFLPLQKLKSDEQGEDEVREE